MIKKEQEGEEEGDNGAEDRGCKKKGKKGGRTLENQRFGHWSPDEKIKYVAFLEFHKNKFELKQQRRYNSHHTGPRRSLSSCRTSFRPGPLTSAGVTTRRWRNTTKM